MKKIILTENQYRLLLEEKLNLNENIQLANKIYFDSGKISEEGKNQILSITNGDNYTKIMSDIWYNLNEYNSTNDKLLELLYNELKRYNNNVLPISGFNKNNINSISENFIGGLIDSLETRRKIIIKLDELPSIAKRNLKNEIQKERNSTELREYLRLLEYFIGQYSLLSNRDEKMRKKIEQKIFKANITLDDLIDFAEEKKNLLGGEDFTKKQIYELSEIEDFEIIYDSNNILIAEVNSPDAIKAIGCNSLWCFTYGSGFDAAYRQWRNHSYDDIVYVIIDLKEKSDSVDFMHVVIKPLTDEEGDLIEYDEDNEDEHPIFNMANDNYNNPYSILEDIFGSNYEDIIRNYLNFE